MAIIERHLQQYLNKLQTWSDENSFKFSKTKTKCGNFCQLRGHHQDPELHLDNTSIEVVPEFNFLGVVFNRKLYFLPYIKALKEKSYKALNLKTATLSVWGADKKSTSRSLSLLYSLQTGLWL